MELEKNFRRLKPVFGGIVKDERKLNNNKTRKGQEVKRVHDLLGDYYICCTIFVE